MPSFVVGVALCCANCSSVDDMAGVETPDGSELPVSGTTPIPAGSASVPAGSAPVPVGSASNPALASSGLSPESVPAGGATLLGSSSSPADTPGWSSGFQQGKLDATRRLSPRPERYEFIYSAADQAGFFQGSEAGYARYKK